MAEFTLYTDLFIVVDRSGSMSSMNGGQIEQIYKLINEQKDLSLKNDINTRISLVSFDDDQEYIVDNINLKEYDVPDYAFFNDKLKPRGCTRFYDTVIECIKKQKDNIKDEISKMHREVKTLDPNVKRILYVLTDGFDNMSKSSVIDLKLMLEEERNDSHFNTIFLGANIGDVEEIAESMGFNRTSALTIGNNYETVSYAMSQVNNMIRMSSLNSQDNDPNAFTFSPLQRACSVSRTQEPQLDTQTQTETYSLQNVPKSIQNPQNTFSPLTPLKRTKVNVPLPNYN